MEVDNSTDNIILSLSPSLLQLEAHLPAPPQRPMWQIVMVAAIATGVQFVWALNLFLLNPYVQLLGIPHTWSSFMWLCGPVSGMKVQPIIGFYSDCCTSRFGRRRPFIAGGAILIAIAVFLIGYAADIGVATGDKLGNATKPRAISVFGIGFWILVVSYNMLQGPCRALFADLSGSNSRKIGTGNALFTLFMAVGNVLGYAAGSLRDIHKMFPFTKTHSCDVYCANLKSCFFISIALLAAITILALTTVREDVFKSEDFEDSDGNSRALKMMGALKMLPKPMWILLLVTCLNWFAWFPWFLLDTDWTGREFYGVNAGALALTMNYVIAGVALLGIDQLSRVCGGVKRLWGGLNLFLAVGLAIMVLVTKMWHFNDGDHNDHVRPPAGVKFALSVFSLLGIPLSVAYTVPWALASIISKDSGVGQGLSLGLLNLAISIPKIFVSLVSGPWDGIFGGNILAFVMATIAAAISGIFAFTLLP